MLEGSYIFIKKLKMPLNSLRFPFTGKPVFSMNWNVSLETL